MEFQDIGTIEVKGKTEQIKVYRPIPGDIEFPTTSPPGSEPRVLRSAYEKQVSNLFSYRLLRPYHVRPPPAKDKTAFSITDGTAGAGAGAGAGSTTPSGDVL